MGKYYDVSTIRKRYEKGSGCKWHNFSSKVNGKNFQIRNAGACQTFRKVIFENTNYFLLITRHTQTSRVTVPCIMESNYVNVFICRDSRKSKPAKPS